MGECHIERSKRVVLRTDKWEGRLDPTLNETVVLSRLRRDPVKVPVRSSPEHTKTSARNLGRVRSALVWV